MILDENRYNSARILVADDQETIISLIERTVRENFRCHITSVGTGDDAIEALENAPFDIFLTDMRMPGLHGIELVKQVAKTAPDTHVLVMTGYPTDFPYIEVIENGAKDFLKKPFLSAELIAKLMRVLEERIMRHDLEVAHTKYRSLFDLSMDGKLLLTMDGLAVEDANQAMCGIVGRKKEELLKQPFLDMLAEDDRERFEQWMAISAVSGKGTIGDLRVMRGNDVGIHVDITITIVDADGEQFAFLSFRDMTEKREVEQRLAEAAQIDELTGLYNKRSFTNRIEWAVSSALASEARLALLTIDLDNFKQCNDTHGHPVGDRLLAAIGHVIKASIRTTAYDEGFRCGGDEFAVLIHNFVDGGPQVVADRMRAKFELVERYGTTMSIGIAEFRPGMNADELIRAADQALYAAKGQGKDAVCTAD